MPELIQGLGQWRAGQGAIVTDWCDSKEQALTVFNRLAADQKTVAERHWQQSPKPAKPQAACDIGLFSDDAKQIDLFQQPSNKGK